MRSSTEVTILLPDNGSKTAMGHIPIVAAPAKINLFLHVLDRYPSGYHELDSLVVFAEVGDELEIIPASDVTLSVVGPMAGSVPVDGSNLILRAASLLRHQFDCAQGAAIKLHKFLPVAAGLGGASSDAAAALRALVSMWGIKVEDSDLISLAASLGADLPACLVGLPARVSGVGEKVQPLAAFPSFPILLVNPGLPLSTSEVFSNVEPCVRSPLKLDYSDILSSLSAGRNDLEVSAISLAPAVGGLLDLLRSLEGCLIARMSGSGGTCFAIFETEVDLNHALWVCSEHAGWWVQRTRVCGLGLE